MQQEIHRGLRMRIRRPLPHKQRSKRMLFRKAVFKRLHHPGRGDGPRHESNPDWFEVFRRKCLGRQARPKTVAVAGYGRETSNSVLTNEIINFATLNVCGAVVSGAGTRVKTSVPC